MNKVLLFMEFLACHFAASSFHMRSLDHMEHCFIRPACRGSLRICDWISYIRSLSAPTFLYDFVFGYCSAHV